MEKALQPGCAADAGLDEISAKQPWPIHLPPTLPEPAERYRWAIDTYIADTEIQDEATQDQVLSLFPDMQKRKKVVASRFIAWCTTALKLPHNVKVLFEPQHFLARAKAFLAYEASAETKPKKALTLHHYRRALIWCAIALHSTTNAFTLFWDRETREYVDAIAQNFKLSHGRRTQLRFSLPELKSFYTLYENAHEGDDFQFYVLHLLFWTTGVRPSSVFRPGRLLSKERLEGSGLKWNHVRFFFTRDGPAAELDFTTLKGKNKVSSRNPVDRLTLLLLPIRQKELLFADLAAHLYILAIVRGVFRWSAEDLLSYKHNDQQPRLIPVKQEMISRPVFQGRSHGMAYNAYLERLKKNSRQVGYVGRVTPYCFRRAALTEYMRHHGRIAAQQLAYHNLESNAIDTYVGNIFKFFDFTAARLGLQQRPQTELEDMFQPTNTYIFQPRGDAPTLDEACNEEVSFRQKNAAPILDADGDTSPSKTTSKQLRRPAPWRLHSMIMDELYEIFTLAHVSQGNGVSANDDTEIQRYSPAMQKVIRQIITTAQALPVSAIDPDEDDKAEEEDEEGEGEGSDAGDAGDENGDDGNDVSDGEDYTGQGKAAHAERQEAFAGCQDDNATSSAGPPTTFVAHPDAMLVRLSLGDTQIPSSAAERSDYISRRVEYILENCASTSRIRLSGRPFGSVTQRASNETSSKEKRVKRIRDAQGAPADDGTSNASGSKVKRRRKRRRKVSAVESPVPKAQQLSVQATVGRLHLPVFPDVLFTSAQCYADVLDPTPIGYKCATRPYMLNTAHHQPTQQIYTQKLESLQQACPICKESIPHRYRSEHVLKAHPLFDIAALRTVKPGLRDTDRVLTSAERSARSIHNSAKTTFQNDEAPEFFSRQILLQPHDTPADDGLMALQGSAQALDFHDEEMPNMRGIGRRPTVVARSEADEFAEVEMFEEMHGIGGMGQHSRADTHREHGGYGYGSAYGASASYTSWDASHIQGYYRRSMGGGEEEDE